MTKKKKNLKNSLTGLEVGFGGFWHNHSRQFSVAEFLIRIVGTHTGRRVYCNDSRLHQKPTP